MTGNLVVAAPSGAAGTAAVVGLLYMLFGVAVYCWYAAALAALFVKIGAPKWKAWVPVVSQMEVLERVGRPAWHVVIVLFVPVYGLWVWALALHRINQSFGRGAGYTVLAVLLPPVWASLLGWGSDQPDFEPQRMYPTMVPSAGRGPLAAPESVPVWAGAPMGAPASAPGQPWAPGVPTGGPAVPAAAEPAGYYAGFGQPTSTPGGLPPVLQAPMPGQAPAPIGQPDVFGQPPAPGDPAVFGQSPVPGDPAVFGQSPVPGDPAVFGQSPVPGGPAVFGQLPVPGGPAVFGQSPVPGGPAVFGQSALPGQPGEPTVIGQPALSGQAAPGEPAAFGQSAAPQPWPQEPVPWPQSSDPSTLISRFPEPDAAVAPYAPQLVDLAAVGQPDPAPSSPPLVPDTVTPSPVFAAPEPAASAAGPEQAVPVPDPRFAAPAVVPPVGLVPDPGTVSSASPGADSGSSAGASGGGLVGLPPGAILSTVSPGAMPGELSTPLVGSASGTALAPAPTPEPVASSLPATSLPAVSATPAPAPAPLTLVGSSSDAQQTVVIPLSDDDIDGTVVVRRPTFQPWVLSLDDGRTFVIRSRSVVLGRRPESVDLGVQVLTITDDGRTISKTHARLDLVDDVWRVVDMGSTNGVVATDADGEEIDVEPGTATPVYGRLVLGAVGMRLTPGGSV